MNLLVNRDLYVSIPTARMLKQVGYDLDGELIADETIDVADDELRLKTVRVNLFGSGYFGSIRRVIKRLLKKIKTEDQLESLESNYESLIKDVNPVYLDIEDFLYMNSPTITVIPKRSDVQWYLCKEHKINITVTYNHYNGLYRAHMITEHFTKHHGEFKTYELAFDDCVNKVCRYILDGKK